jgi:hypothetical protein
MHNPTTSHWIATKRVFRFLKGIVHHGLFFGKGSLLLNAYSDSDWAGNPNDARSTTGYAIFLGTCLINGSAKKQLMVSKCGTEAKYQLMAFAFATAKLYWLRMLFQELQLQISVPPVLWCDNIGVLSLASNPIFMPELNMLKWTTTLFERKWFASTLSLGISLLLNKLQIFLPRG